LSDYKSLIDRHADKEEVVFIIVSQSKKLASVLLDNLAQNNIWVDKDLKAIFDFDLLSSEPICYQKTAKGYQKNSVSLDDLSKLNFY